MALWSLLVAGAADVEHAHFSLVGQRVDTLIDETHLGGYTIHNVGSEDHGRPMASGAYLYRLRIGDQAPLSLQYVQVESGFIFNAKYFNTCCISNLCRCNLLRNMPAK